jgi:hypothetical protein
MQIKSDNVFDDEIEANGLPKFYWALPTMSLIISSFIHSLISSRLKKFLSQFPQHTLSRNIVAEQPK